MTLITIFLVIILGDVVTTYDVEEPIKVLTSITETIGSKVWECRKEIQFNISLIETLQHYWNAMTSLTDVTLGCVVMCVLNKLELITPDFDLQVQNAKSFGEANGASKFISDGLIELYNLCRDYSKVDDGCVKALDIARCFRAGVFQLQWEPTFNNYEDY